MLLEILLEFLVKLGVQKFWDLLTRFVFFQGGRVTPPSGREAAPMLCGVCVLTVVLSFG